MSKQENLEFIQASFPIKQAEEHRVNRRHFATFCGCSLVALGAGVPLRNKLMTPPKTGKPITVGNDADIEPGGYLLFRYPTENHPCILVRLKDGSLAAYSQACTHLMCPVYFSGDADELICPCHSGHFDARNGAVLAGPPQRPLPRYQVRVIDYQIVVGPELLTDSPETHSKHV